MQARPEPDDAWMMKVLYTVDLNEFGIRREDPVTCRIPYNSRAANLAWDPVTDSLSIGRFVSNGLELPYSQSLNEISLALQNPM
jgi:hypothetical protein